MYEHDRFISPEDNSGSCISGDPPLLGLQREHARLYKCLQSLLQRPATHGRMADVAMEYTVQVSPVACTSVPSSLLGPGVVADLPVESFLLSGGARRLARSRRH